MEFLKQLITDIQNFYDEYPMMVGCIAIALFLGLLAAAV